MADEQFESVEAAGGAHETTAGEDVTSEFVAGVERPSSSVNGYGVADEPPFPQNPEIVVGAAFLGGFLLGRLVRRLGS